MYMHACFAFLRLYMCELECVCMCVCGCMYGCVGACGVYLHVVNLFLVAAKTFSVWFFSWGQLNDLCRMTCRFTRYPPR